MHPRYLKILVVMLGLLVAGSASAQDENPTPSPDNGSDLCFFIDEDGDGFNDLAPDADGDGIPNGLDPDYVKPEDGEGQQHQWRHMNGFFAKVFGFSLNEQSNGYHHGADADGGLMAGPGTGTGFGTGMMGSDGSGSGENQAEQAGHRGGRR